MANDLGISKTRFRTVIARQRDLPSTDNRVNSHKAITVVNNSRIVELLEKKMKLEKMRDSLYDKYNGM